MPSSVSLHKGITPPYPGAGFRVSISFTGYADRCIYSSNIYSNPAADLKNPAILIAL